jgi:AraC-like DNA-binding protein
VELPGDFPLLCSGLYRQHDAPITRLHRHDVPEIGYCHNGSGIWMVEGKILPYGPGDVILITQDETHLAQSSPGTVSEWTWIYSDPHRLFLPLAGGAAVADLSALSGPSFVNVFSAATYPDLSRTALAIVNEFQAGRPMHRDVLTGFLYALFAMLRRTAVAGASPQRRMAAEHRGALERVMPAVEHICAYYAEPLTVATLARCCFASETHFRRLFVQALGQGPQAYLGSVRISMAAVQLRATAQPVSTLARRCGFETLSSFNRMFKAQIGVTPRQWRQGMGSHD